MFQSYFDSIRNRWWFSLLAFILGLFSFDPSIIIKAMDWTFTWDTLAKLWPNIMFGLLVVAYLRALNRIRKLSLQLNEVNDEINKSENKMKRLRLFSEVLNWVHDQRFLNIKRSFTRETFKNLDDREAIDKVLGFFTYEKDHGTDSMEYKLKNQLEHVFTENSSRGTMTLDEKKFIIDCICHGKEDAFWEDKTHQFSGLK